MDVNHPDIEEFITSKNDTTKITGANISVKVDDAFMMNIFQDYIKNSEKGIFDNSDNKKIWNKLVYQAWHNAEPGILFWDKITSESPADCYDGFESTSTNPLAI